MSDEEKKATDELKEEINKPLEVPEDKFNTFILYNIESAKTILTLIEKQSKEIEELKDFNTKLQATKDRLDSYDKENTSEIEKLKKEIEELKKNKGYHLGFIDGGIAKKYEYQDKIKAKIEDILNSENGEAIEKLIEWQSLL